MAGYGNNYGGNRRDEKIVKRTKIKESKNGAEYEYAYAEIGGKLYKISITNCNKDSDKDNAGSHWIGIQCYGSANGGNRGGNRGGGYQRGNGPMRSYGN